MGYIPTLVLFYFLYQRLLFHLFTMLVEQVPRYVFVPFEVVSSYMGRKVVFHV